MIKMVIKRSIRCELQKEKIYKDLKKKRLL